VNGCVLHLEFEELNVHHGREWRESLSLLTICSGGFLDEAVTLDVHCSSQDAECTVHITCDNNYLLWTRLQNKLFDEHVFLWSY